MTIDTLTRRWSGHLRRWSIEEANARQPQPKRRNKMGSMKITVLFFGFVLIFIMGMLLGLEWRSSDADEMCFSVCQRSGWDTGTAGDNKCVCSTTQTKDL